MAERVTLKIPTGECLSLTGDQARSLAARLWEIAAYDGAVSLATAIREALATADLVNRAIDLTSRERAALVRLLGEELNVAAAII